MKKAPGMSPLFEVLPMVALSFLIVRAMEAQKRMYKILIYSVVGAYFLITVCLLLILTMRFAHG